MAPRDIVSTPRPSSLDDVHTLLERAVALGGYSPSPADWRDEVLYFLLPDRFSDGKEDRRELLTQQRRAALRTTPARPDIDWREWAASGARWQGGTIAGIRGRLDYLQGLGVTTLWIGPIFKQRARLDTFHGYGVQDFLDVDPRFGSRDDLVDLVEEAHARGLRIILDIIANHTGDNWGYVPPGDGRTRRATSRRSCRGPSSTARPRAAARVGPSRSATSTSRARPASVVRTTACSRWTCARRRTTRAPAPARSIAAASTIRTPSTSAPTSSRSRTWPSTAATRCRRWSIASITGSRSATATASASTR